MNSSKIDDLLILLDSVGCVLDLETLMTHPLDDQGHPVLDDGVSVHLDDTCDSWRSSLNQVDRWICLAAQAEVERQS